MGRCGSDQFLSFTSVYLSSGHSLDEMRRALCLDSKFANALNTTT
jgi:hypothetical protein